MPITPHDWSLCVAPMMDWTDKHCRYFHRLLAPKARLYTEMVTTGALLHGHRARHLDFNAAEHPVALQLGGSEAADLAYSARLGQQWGYDEINLNCGCPSERVQKGAFGACLMAEPRLVADCVKAMRDAVQIPVTVKHRIGLDDNESYSFVRDFVGTVHEAGCEVFIVHARNAVLKGLSPKDNRSIPPLRYNVVYQLKRDFPHLRFVLNGGLNSVDALRYLQPDDAGQAVDGLMFGREAWNRPRVLSEVSRLLWPAETIADDASIVAAMMQYAHEQVTSGVPMRVVTKPMLSFTNGMSGARRWRQILSDAARLSTNQPEILLEAWNAIWPSAAPAA